MSLPIHKLGGLTEGDTKALILSSEQKVGVMLDEKLGSLRDDINVRMDKHEAHVGERLDKQDVMVQEVLSVVKGIASKGDGWHVEDLKWRGKTDSRINKLEDMMRSLKMWLATFRAMALLRKTTLYVVKEGRPYLLAVTSLGTAWMVLVQFVHTVWPDYIHPWLTHFLAHH